MSREQFQADVEKSNDEVAQQTSVHQGAVVALEAITRRLNAAFLAFEKANPGVDASSMLEALHYEVGNTGDLAAALAESGREKEPETEPKDDDKPASGAV